MATKKVSALTELTSPDGSEELLVNDGGTSKKVTIDNLLYDESIDSDHYVDGSIDNAHLADDAVGVDELSATGSASSSTFLRGDNAWATPTDTDTTYSAGSSSALGLIKLEDDNVQTTAASSITTTAARTYGLQVNSSGQGVVNVPWADTDTNTTYSNFTGDSGSGGAAGLVPAPGAGDTASGKYLDSDGTWTVPPDTDTTNDVVDDTSPQLGGFLDANGNYMQTEKGGDIASASPTVIDTDGDYFNVTGTTNFAAFTVAADRQFTLQFDGILTMTHHATNLDLPGEANITTAAGDVATFQSTAANQVQCINYTRADGTAIVGAGGTLAALTDATVSASDPATDTNPSATGHYWVNKTSGECYVCTTATTDKNVWTNVGPGTGDIVPPPYNVEYLVIAGGSGGYVGGGGAGGYRNSYNSETSGGGGSSETALTLVPSTQYTVTVGAGSPSDATTTGGVSVFSTITSTGGGNAGQRDNSLYNGYSGGSGGGGGVTASGDGTTSSGGAGTANQGYAGGAGRHVGGNYEGMGGGGGAGGAGGSYVTTTGGAGGAGVASAITGSSVTRAGGGGGGAQTTGGAAGSGGGTAGQAGTNATINTGSGSGGWFGGAPGSGGSGVVILRMLDADYSGTTTGSPTVATGVSGDTVLTFTGSGTYTA